MDEQNQLDINDLFDQINEQPANQEQENVSTNNDSALPSSISGFGEDNQQENQQFLEENQNQEAIIWGPGLIRNENHNDDIHEKESALASSVSKTETSEFIPEVIEIKKEKLSEEKEENADIRNLNINFPFSPFDSSNENITVYKEKDEKIIKEEFPNIFNSAQILLNLHDPNTINYFIKNDQMKISSLDIALSRNNIDEIESLLKYSGNPNKMSRLGLVPGKSILHHLLKEPINNEKNLEKIELFIKYGADIDINAKNLFGWTPLHYAVNYWENNINLVKLLIKYGADPKNKIPIDLCNEKETIEFLKDFENLDNEIKKYENDLKNSELSKEDKIKIENQLKILDQSKQELLKINNEIIPINKKMKWIEQQENMKDQYENQSQSRNESEELKDIKDDDSDKNDTSNYSETFSGLKAYFEKSAKEVTKEEAKKMGAIPKGSKIVSNQNTNEIEKLKIKLSSLKIEEEQTSTSGCKPFQEIQKKKDDDSDKDDKFKSSEKKYLGFKKGFLNIDSHSQSNKGGVKSSSGKFHPKKHSDNVVSEQNILEQKYQETLKNLEELEIAKQSELQKLKEFKSHSWTQVKEKVNEKQKSNNVENKKLTKQEDDFISILPNVPTHKLETKNAKQKQSFKNQKRIMTNL